MSTSVFFQQEDYSQEQELIEDLIVEAIQIHGIECFYLPRKTYSVDKLLTEDDQYYFDDAIPIETYIKNFDQFGGQRNFLSNFGIEIRDRLDIVIARRTWTETVGDPRKLNRPNEGDMIYFNANKRLFEVRYVERYSLMYPLGSLPTWELQCELVEAVSQRMDTGIDEIDAFEQVTSEDLFRWAIRTVDGKAIRTAGNEDYWVVDSRNEAVIDPLDQSKEISTEAEVILNFDETDPFAEGSFS